MLKENKNEIQKPYSAICDEFILNIVNIINDCPIHIYSKRDMLKLLITELDQTCELTRLEEKKKYDKMLQENNVITK